MMNIRELRLLIQADLVRGGRVGYCVVMPLTLIVVIPEVSDRESTLQSSGSSTKTPRG
jgi:hypothetical protein